MLQYVIHNPTLLVAGLEQIHSIQTFTSTAVLKQIERASESDEKRAARLQQQRIFIPQWPELPITTITKATLGIICVILPSSGC